MAHKCPLCHIFQNRTWTIENLPTAPGEQEFPAEFNQLIPYQLSNNPGSRSNDAYQCPRCGLMYERTVRSPGGSNDAMQSWIVETLAPMTKRGRHLRKNIQHIQSTTPKVAEFACPDCKGTDVETVNAGIIGGEVFVELKCRSCGNTDTLDQYQLMRWRFSAT